MANGRGGRSSGARWRGRETRVEIDIEEEILAKYPNRRIDLAAAEAEVDAGPSWSASTEAGIVVETPAATDEVVIDRVEEPAARELVESGVGGRGARRGRRTRPAATGLPPRLGDDWDPSQPLPGEPADRDLRPPMRSAPQLAARLAEQVGDDTRAVLTRSTPVIEGPPDAYEMLRRQRDHIARQVQRSYREVHAVRTEALRRASQAEASAERAATARERAARLVREGRRIGEAGRRVSAEVPAPRDSFRAVHELRIESLKKAAEAEHGAERVQMLREKAARLLAEQRRLEAEMAKHLAGRLG